MCGNLIRVRRCQAHEAHVAAQGPSRRTEIVLRGVPSSALTFSAKACRKVAALRSRPANPGGGGGNGRTKPGSSRVPPHSEGTSSGGYLLPCADAFCAASSAV